MTDDSVTQFVFSLSITGSGRERYCWAQSVDLRNPWIALRNLWIHTLRRNPWIAQESVNRAGRSIHFAYDSIHLAQTYMDGLVISTIRTKKLFNFRLNLKFNNFTHFISDFLQTMQSSTEKSNQIQIALSYKKI